MNRINLFTLKNINKYELNQVLTPACPLGKTLGWILDNMLTTS